MPKEEIYLELLRIANSKLESLKIYIESEAIKGYLRLGDVKDDGGFEFNAGLRRFLIFLEITLSQNFDDTYCFKTKEIIVNGDNYGSFKLKEVKEFDIEGSFDDVIYFKNAKTINIRDRDVDATVIQNFAPEYIRQLLKKLQKEST